MSFLGRTDVQQTPARWREWRDGALFAEARNVSKDILRNLQACAEFGAMVQGGTDRRGKQWESVWNGQLSIGATTSLPRGERVCSSSIRAGMTSESGTVRPMAGVI